MNEWTSISACSLNHIHKALTVPLVRAEKDKEHSKILNA